MEGPTVEHKYNTKSYYNSGGASNYQNTSGIAIEPLKCHALCINHDRPSSGWRCGLLDGLLQCHTDPSVHTLYFISYNNIMVVFSSALFLAHSPAPTRRSTLPCRSTHPCRSTLPCRSNLPCHAVVSPRGRTTRQRLPWHAKSTILFP